MAFLLEDFDERLGEIDLDVLGLVGACILLCLAFAVGAGEKRPDEVLVRLDLLLACRELLACVRRVVDADGACRVLAALARGPCSSVALPDLFKAWRFEAPMHAPPATWRLRRFAFQQGKAYNNQFHDTQHSELQSLCVPSMRKKNIPKSSSCHMRDSSDGCDLVPVGRRLGGVEEESDRVGHCCELMHVLSSRTRLGVSLDTRISVRLDTVWT